MRFKKKKLVKNLYFIVQKVTKLLRKKIVQELVQLVLRVPVQVLVLKKTKVLVLRVVLKVSGAD